MDEYVVLVHQQHWKIRHQGNYSEPYLSRREALSAAIRQAHATGRGAEVHLQDFAQVKAKVVWKAMATQPH